MAVVYSLRVTAMAVLLASVARGADAQAPAPKPTPTSLAEWILRAPAIRPGLCLCLGVRDTELMTTLASRGQYLVHGIVTDESAAIRMRRKILTKGMYGAVSVNRCSLDRLPYADNLANLVIVADLHRATSAGLRLGEVRRVLAPLGTGLIRYAHTEEDQIRSVYSR